MASMAWGQAQYPAHWWTPINDPRKPDWEILPQAAKPGEVIVSKRNELGILSNFAATAFTYQGKRYASVEGFWQMMLYPEGSADPRTNAPGMTWRYTRQQVAQMTSFQAKSAGTLAEDNMQQLHIDWVTFEGQRMPYRSKTKGLHYRLIREAMQAKLEQNSQVRTILLSTGNLILRPDHIQEENTPPEWSYTEIWMEIRTELQKQMASSAEFSDPQPFAAAGVADHTYVGGHASEETARTAQSMGRSLQSDGISLDEAKFVQSGTALLTQGVAQRAAAVFLEGLSSYPDSERLLLGEGAALLYQRDNHGAADFFYRAVDKHPSDMEPYSFLARIDDPQITASDEFLARMKRVAALHPNSAQAQTWYAAALWRRSQGDEAEALLRQAITLDSACSAAHFELGVVFLETNRPQQAIPEFQASLRIDPNQRQTHYRLAAAYRKTGQTQLAAQETAAFRHLQ